MWTLYKTIINFQKLRNSLHNVIKFSLEDSVYDCLIAVKKKITIAIFQIKLKNFKQIFKYKASILKGNQPITEAILTNILKCFPIVYVLPIYF